MLKGISRRTAGAVLTMVAMTGGIPGGSNASAQEPTYAERLGYEEGAKVAILHVDDAGMSHESNIGALRSIREGVANSMSVMMPCGWVPELAKEILVDPSLDAGLHLTLTSEWDGYRWGPLAGKTVVPGLVDPEECLWPSVADVVAHASPDEVEAEIRAQIARARGMGFEPTHMDSHMGTLFATPEFLERYVRVGIEEGIPVMLPGGHNTLLKQQYRNDAIAELKRSGTYSEGQEIPLPERLARAVDVGRTVWAAGLPVLDDLHNTSYGWRLGAGEAVTEEALTELKVARYSEALRSLEPGVTMIIMHCTAPSANFDAISTSGPTRAGDLYAMLDPRLRRVIEEEGIILATWRELAERRDRVAD